MTAASLLALWLIMPVSPAPAPEDYEARCKRWYCPAVGPCVCREWRK